MRSTTSTRYCADPEAISALRRDGLGWGHDLDCGCFRDHGGMRKPGPLARLLAAMKRGD